MFFIGSNEYTTTAQRQAQQKSLQEQKARENYIYKMNAKKNQSYGNTSSAGAKTFGGDSTPKAVNSVY
ncbi:MAG: hypothetical protein IJW74_02440 [Oscillospiraceae bacterium]|nr:hypothetical protein [Oscillospiraceae bacterium]